MFQGVEVFNHPKPSERHLIKFITIHDLKKKKKNMGKNSYTIQVIVRRVLILTNFSELQWRREQVLDKSYQNY